MADPEQTTSVPSTGTTWDDRRYVRGYAFGYPLKVDNHNLMAIAAERHPIPPDTPSDRRDHLLALETAKVMTDYHDAASRAVRKEPVIRLVYAPISGRTYYLLGFPFQLYSDEIVRFKSALDGLKLGKLGWYTIGPCGTSFPNACMFCVLRISNRFRFRFRFRFRRWGEEGHHVILLWR